MSNLLGYYLKRQPRDYRAISFIVAVLVSLEFSLITMLTSIWYAWAWPVAVLFTVITASLFIFNVVKYGDAMNKKHGALPGESVTETLQRLRRAMPFQILESSVAFYVLMLIGDNPTFGGVGLTAIISLGVGAVLVPMLYQINKLELQSPKPAQK